MADVLSNVMRSSDTFLQWIDYESMHEMKLRQLVIDLRESLYGTRLKPFEFKLVLPDAPTEDWRGKMVRLSENLKYINQYSSPQMYAEKKKELDAHEKALVPGKAQHFMRACIIKLEFIMTYVLLHYDSKTQNPMFDMDEKLKIEQSRLRTIENAIQKPSEEMNQIITEQRARVFNCNISLRQRSIKRAKVMHAMLQNFQAILELGLPIVKDGVVSFNWNENSIDKLYKFTTPTDIKEYEVFTHLTNPDVLMEIERAEENLMLPKLLVERRDILETCDLTYFWDDDESLPYEKRLKRKSVLPGRISQDAMDEEWYAYHLARPLTTN